MNSGRWSIIVHTTSASARIADKVEAIQKKKANLVKDYLKDNKKGN